jgi:hypothetical protein
MPPRELVAELGAAFLCADIGITPEPREDHTSYIASWLQVLKNDKRAIFTAAAPRPERERLPARPAGFARERLMVAYFIRRGANGCSVVKL